MRGNVTFLFETDKMQPDCVDSDISNATSVGGAGFKAPGLHELIKGTKSSNKQLTFLYEIYRRIHTEAWSKQTTFMLQRPRRLASDI